MLLNSIALMKSYQGFSFSGEQNLAVTQLLRWQKALEHAVLEGYAGTGKTTVLTALILELALSKRQIVQVATPTHKAAKVLNGKLGEWGARLGLELPSAVTIHSLLAIKPKKTKPNEPEAFVISGAPKLYRNSFLIVDECSMINKELFMYIMECATSFKATVLFSGDPKQLRPVNEGKISPTFSIPNKYTLTEVQRYGGVILDLATKLRLAHKHALPVVETKSDGTSKVITYRSLPNLIESWLNEVENSHLDDPCDNDYQDPLIDDCVLVTWTNAQRRAANIMARKRLYGDDVPDFMPGDKLVMIKAFTVGDTIIFANNEDIEITKAELITRQPVAQLPFIYKCWKLQVKDACDIYVLIDSEIKEFKRNCDSVGKTIKSDVEQATAHYAAIENLLKDKRLSKAEIRYHSSILSAMEKLREAKERWKTEYFALKDSFAHVDFGYAITTHKSQGSTYRKVFVHPDMLHSKDERLTLMYVAVTRASKEIHHLALPCEIT